MLSALVLLNIVHPGQIMPGKESDLPSRKQRKAIGKKNVRGRMASHLPLHEPSNVQIAEPPAQVEKSSTYPKNDETTISYGYVRDYES